MNSDALTGMFLGLAIGDAVGTTIEFQARDTYRPMTDMVGGGPFRLKAGAWTDDTSLMLATAAVLEGSKGYSAKAVATEMLAWSNGRKHSHRGCFDIGGNTAGALARFARTRDPYQGDALSGGNGAMMRVIPFIVRHFNDPQLAVARALDCARITNGNRDAAYATELFAKLLAVWAIDPEYEYATLRRHFERVERDAVPSGGFTVETLYAALWAVATTDSFEAAVLKAVNLGHDADSVGAATGALAGVRYGLRGIPQRWLNKLVWRDRMERYVRNMIDRGYREDGGLGTGHPPAWKFRQALVKLDRMRDAARARRQSRKPKMSAAPGIKPEWTGLSDWLDKRFGAPDPKGSDVEGSGMVEERDFFAFDGGRA